MNRTKTLKRVFTLLIGLAAISLGIAFTKHSGLGVSPISTLPNVLSLRFPLVSIGTFVAIVYTVLVLLQMLLLGRRAKASYLLQIPLSLLTGVLTDGFLACIAPFPTGHYLLKLLALVLGIASLGFGISLTVEADLIMNAPEAFVNALAFKMNKKFGDIKTAFDVAFVAFSALLSLILFSGKLVGIREGTLLAAVFTGIFVKIFTKWMQ